MKAHQRKTVQDWRVEALEERMRWEKLDKKDLPETISKAADNAASGEDMNDAEATPGGATGDDQSINSSTSKKNAHKSTLRLLNSNGPSTNRRSSLSGISASDSADSTVPGTGSGDRSSLTPEMELRLVRLERNSEALLRGIMPLLENMNQTLGTMQRDTVSRELSIEFLDLALASARTSVDARRQGAIMRLEEEGSNRI